MESKGFAPEGLDRLEIETITGGFGEYLANPLDSKERMKVVARNMALCRKEVGMSQKDVCTVIGCAPQTYSGYEKGKHEPTLETLVRLAHLYSVSLDFLIGRNEHDAMQSAMEERKSIDNNISLMALLERIERLEQKEDK